MEYTNTKNENNIGIDITSTFAEWVKGFPGDKKDINYHGYFKITLTTESGSDSFDYYGSAFDAGKNKTDNYISIHLYTYGSEQNPKAGRV